MKNKKILIALLLILTLFMFAACGTNGDGLVDNGRTNGGTNGGYNDGTNGTGGVTNGGSGTGLGTGNDNSID